MSRHRRHDYICAGCGGAFGGLCAVNDRGVPYCSPECFASRLRDLTEWQDISTAPRDGTIIVVDDDDPAEEKLARAIGVPRRPRTIYLARWFKGGWRDYHHMRRLRPTRFVALPQPPEDA